VTAGQVHESTQFESLVATFIASRKGRRRQKPKKLAADKAYSGQSIADWLKARRIEPVIPLKSNQSAPPGRKFDRAAYRQRAVVEQAVGWLKEYRRIGTRFEKLAVNFHGMIKLAMISRYLRLLFSDRA
jgi:transposase